MVIVSIQKEKVYKHPLNAGANKTLWELQTSAVGLTRSILFEDTEVHALRKFSRYPLYLPPLSLDQARDNLAMLVTSIHEYLLNCIQRDGHTVM